MELPKILWQFTILAATEANTNLTLDPKVCQIRQKLLMWKVVFLIQKMNLFPYNFTIYSCMNYLSSEVNSFVKYLIKLSKYYSL